MIVEWKDHREIVDFVVPTLDEARGLIAEGATNRIDLLEQAGLSWAEAEADLRRIETERLDSGEA